MRRISTFLVSALILVTSAASAAEDGGGRPAEETLCDATVVELASRMLGEPLDRDTTTPITSRVRMDKAGRAIQEVLIGNLWVLVHPDEMRIGAFHLRSQAVPDRTQDGRAVTNEIFSEELARVPIDKAERIATAFVARNFGPKRIAELERHSPRVVSTGPGYYYYFCWSNRPGKDGVFIGHTSLSLSVRATDGKVFSGGFVFQRVGREPRLSADAARDLAAAEVRSLGLNACLSLKDTHLLPHEGAAGDSVLDWVFLYEVQGTCPEGMLPAYQRDFEIRIRDSSGEVVSHSWSDDSDDLAAE